MNRRQLNTLAALLACGASPTFAQIAEPRRYGALSLIGDKVNVVTAQPITGTNLDRNIQSQREMAVDLFDLEALRVIQASIKADQPDAGPVMLYKSRSPQLGDRPWELFDGDKVLLPPDELAQMKTDGTTRLLLVTRHRDEAELKARHSRMGDGKLEGLGYFVNYHERMKRSDTGESGVGFLAPYVYLRLSLINLETNTLLGQQNIHGSTTFAASRAKESVNPWDVLSAEDKLKTLVRIMDRELRAAVPKLLTTT